MNSPQKENVEKRAAARDHTEIPVTCSRFSIYYGNSMHEGIMLNCSVNGSYIELSQSIDKGTIIMVKPSETGEGHGVSDFPIGFRSISLAEVRWSRDVDDDLNSRFGLGLKYFNL